MLTPWLLRKVELERQCAAESESPHGVSWGGEHASSHGDEAWLCHVNPGCRPYQNEECLVKSIGTKLIPTVRASNDKATACCHPGTRHLNALCKDIGFNVCTTRLQSILTASLFRLKSAFQISKASENQINIPTLHLAFTEWLKPTLSHDFLLMLTWIYHSVSHINTPLLFEGIIAQRKVL